MVYSGVMNFIGVLRSSGAVAFSIITLLPVELILKVSKGAGFSMVFALLVAAILWNLATWWRGLPASSSHTMIGSIIGVGIANQLMQGNSGTAGVEWEQVTKVFKALLSLRSSVSSVPLWSSSCSNWWPAIRAFMKPQKAVRHPRSISVFYLILTCGGVSYAHGSNDGQKGMGLIMLILVGTGPDSLRAQPRCQCERGANLRCRLHAGCWRAEQLRRARRHPTGRHPRARTLRQHQEVRARVILALQQEVTDIRNEATSYGSLGNVPPEMQANVRNQMYLTSESFRILAKSGPKISDGDEKIIANYKGFLDKSTRFIPTWVKVAVALALGLGTMVGWKRIVVTVGEKIGKTHLTYAQGASAELVAMCTILAADTYGLPVSTTHVLSSGVAGTMAANKSGLQLSTIRDIAMAWVFTFPARRCSPVVSSGSSTRS